jgi:undecaprenyl-diphosphatase
MNKKVIRYLLASYLGKIDVMSFLDSMILGLIQGVTEFIPVSSSGHLVIVSHILGLGDTFAFDVLLNFGTLLALMTYYQKRIWQIIKRLITGKQFKLIALLMMATIPAATVGLLFDEQISNLNTKVWVVIIMLIVVGIPMIIFGRENTPANDEELDKTISWTTSIKIGLAQAIALIPGTSRSGITILAGLKCGLSAKKAAEFSFLLAIPIIAVASFKMLFSEAGLNYVNDNLGAVIIGNLVSFATGLLAVKFLISLIGKRGLKDFGWYRLGLAIVLIILLVTGII